MPTNKHASFRYRVLDQCFRQPKKWTKDALLERVSAQLKEEYGRLNPIKARTLAQDIQIMRSAPPKGWKAPIKCLNGAYFYEDRSFSIENTGLRPKEIAAIQDAVGVLRQFAGLPHVGALSAVLDRVEDRAKYPDKSLIQFETNEQLRGLEYLAPLYAAAAEGKALRITYQSFQEPEPVRLVFHPYLLKEYRNRWFAFGLHHELREIWNLPLDRIQEMVPSIVAFVPNQGWDPVAHFRDIVGVTRYKDRALEDIVFETTLLCADYLLTKPIHHSQQVLYKDAEKVRFSLRVIPNRELASELLRWGRQLRVTSPEPGLVMSDW